MRGCFCNSFIILLLGVFISSLHAEAQNVIDGKVIDDQTSEPLPGATVKIQNSGRGTVTDINGYFSFDNINQEMVQIITSFIGYESQEVSYSVDSDVNKIPIIRMRQASEQIEEVEIEGRAKGRVKAMLIQKRAINIKNVISSQQINEFPDMNAAEAMARIPGISLQRDQGDGKYVQLRGTPPELTNFNINGEQIPSPEGDFRYVGMDIISADQIELIEVSKVLTPDMDADGIAGTVNIVTKKAESNVPEVKISSAGGYNNLRGTDNYQLQFSFAQRHKKFGFNINANYYINHQGSDNMEFKYEKGTFRSNEAQQAGSDNYHLQYRDVQLRHYNITRERIGISSTLDYEFNKKHTIYLRGMYNKYSDDEIRRRKVYELDDASSLNSYLYGGIQHDVRDRVQNQYINSLNFGGDNDLDFIKIDYGLSYSTAREEVPQRVMVEFDNPGQYIHIKFNTDDPDWPKAYFPSTTPSKGALDYDNYEFNKLELTGEDVNDKNISSKINFKIPYDLGFQHGFMKFGGKARFKDKTRDINTESYAAYFENSSIYPLSGPPLTLGSVKGNFKEDNLLNKGFQLSHMPSPERMLKFYTDHQQLFIYGDEGVSETLINSYGEDYTAEEDIYAFYGMLKHNIDRFMFLGGVRYERTDVDYQGYEIFLMPSGYFDSLANTSDARSHEFLLPQFQVKYRVSESFNLRGAWTYSYSRPNFRDVLPYREVDYGSDEIKYGNPDINYPKSMNIDLLAEKYLSDNGIISGGVYYKRINNFIFYYKIFGHEQYLDYTDKENKYEFTIPMNGLEAFVYGAEIQSQFKLNFLPGRLKDIGIFANYSYTHSEAYINKRHPANDHSHNIVFGEDYDTYFENDTKEKLSLPGQAEHTFNLAIFFDSKKFYAKLSGNYHDDFLETVGADKDLDEYYAKMFRMDFTSNYQINDYIKVFVDVINLTNEPLKKYLGTPEMVKQQEFYSWWGRIGFNLNF